jgi:hypothetical protein
MTDDLDRIMEVMEAAFDPAFGEAWTRPQVEDALILPNTHYLLAGPDGRAPDEGGSVAGFVLSRGAAVSRNARRQPGRVAVSPARVRQSRPPQGLLPARDRRAARCDYLCSIEQSFAIIVDSSTSQALVFSGTCQS